MRVFASCSFKTLHLKFLFKKLQNWLDVDKVRRRLKLGLLAGVSSLLAFLGHTGRRVVLGHTLNTQTLKTDEQKKGFKWIYVLCWAAFTAILGHRLDTQRAGLWLHLQSPTWTWSSEVARGLRSAHCLFLRLSKGKWGYRCLSFSFVLSRSVSKLEVLNLKLFEKWLFDKSLLCRQLCIFLSKRSMRTVFAFWMTSNKMEFSKGHF